MPRMASFLKVTKMALDSSGRINRHVKSAPLPNEKARVQKTSTEVKEAKPGKITMVDLLKAQRKIDENSKKAGIEKPPLSRPRSKQTLPIANK